jgi:hypothetical protein
VRMMSYLLTFMIGAFTPNLGFATSFNCAKAKGPVENTICSDQVLSKLDELLSISYNNYLSVHPVPEYVKASQIDWLSLNNYCMASDLTNCLVHNYLERVSLLLGTKDLTVFSSSRTFSHDSGDAIVQYWKDGEVWKLNIWGGFFIHRLSSEEQGRPIYTGCEFNGTMKDPNLGHAIDALGNEVDFVIEGNKLTVSEDSKICWGFGRLPDSFQRVRK